MFKLEPRKEAIGGNNDVAEDDSFKGFIEISKNEWQDIEINSYIKYEKTNGEVVKGGFVINKSLEKGIIFLTSKLNDMSQPRWAVNISTITRIWKKSVTPWAENTNSLARSIKNINDRLVVVENTLNERTIESMTTTEDENNNLRVRIISLEEDLKKMIQVVNEIVQVVNKSS